MMGLTAGWTEARTSTHDLMRSPSAWRGVSTREVMAISTNLQNLPTRQSAALPHFPDGATEAQRDLSYLLDIAQNQELS